MSPAIPSAGTSHSSSAKISTLARVLGVSYRTIAYALARLRDEGKVFTYRCGHYLELGLAPKSEAPLPILDKTGKPIGNILADQEIERNTVQDEANTPKIEVRQRTLPHRGSRTGLQPVLLPIANVKNNGAPAPAPAEPSPAPLDTFLDTFWGETPKRTKRSEDGPPPPRTPRQHRVDAGSVAWTFEVLPPGVSINHRQRPQEEEKAKHLLDPQPAEYMLSLEEGNERFAAVLAELRAKPNNTHQNHQTSSEAYHQALERRRRRTRYGGE